MSNFLDVLKPRDKREIKKQIHKQQQQQQQYNFRFAPIFKKSQKVNKLITQI